MVIFYLYKKFHGDFKCDIFLSPFISPGSFPDFTREQTSFPLQKQTLLSEIYAERPDTDQLWRPYLRRVLSDFPVPYNITLTSGLINQQILHHAELKVYKPSNCKIKLIYLFIYLFIYYNLMAYLQKRGKKNSHKDNL